MKYEKYYKGSTIFEVGIVLSAFPLHIRRSPGIKIPLKMLSSRS